MNRSNVNNWRIKRTGVDANPFDIKVDPATAFDFAFLTDTETVSFIKERGRVMFIIRGPAFTKKTLLAHLLRRKYAEAVYCSAVKHIDDNIPQGAGYAGKNTILQTHKFCEAQVKMACLSNKSPIIIQNSHIRKAEVDGYLQMAAQHHYTVVMVSTVYKLKLNPTIEAIKNVKHLDINYQVLRIKQWENIVPMFTGWFVCDSDAHSLRSYTHKTLQTVFVNQELRTAFNFESSKDIEDYYNAKQMISCLAAYSKNTADMKEYYVSKEVQDSYGKVLTICLVAYLITKSHVIGIVQLSGTTSKLLLADSIENEGDIHILDNAATEVTTRNILEHRKLAKFSEGNMSEKGGLVFKKWGKAESISAESCSFIHLAQKSGLHSADILEVKRIFRKYLHLVSDEDELMQQHNLEKLGGLKVRQVRNEAWLVKLPQKIYFKSLFTGYYV